MQSHIVPKRILSIGIVVGVLLALMFLPYFFRENVPLPVLETRAESLFSIGKPVRVIIPSIDVDASVEYVGLTALGAMDVPKDPNAVAWFNLGVRPGEEGSAVIAGHSGYKNKPAVFDNLHLLQNGSQFSIEDDKGITTSFVVRDIRMYDLGADAGDVFGSSDGIAHLNLVTCEGVWDAVSKTYSKRRVVFADAMP